MNDINIAQGEPSAAKDVQSVTVRSDTNVARVFRSLHSTLSRFLQWKYASHTIVFLVITCVWCGIFWNVLWNVPSYLRGDAVLSSDELVPIFDWKSQYLDFLTHDISPLTDNTEFRYRYFFLTSWIRYFKILPIGLVVSAILSTFVGYLASRQLVSRMLRADLDEKIGVLASGLAAIFINIMLWYAKMPNFYSLIIGFNLFALAIALLVRSFFEHGKYAPWTIGIACIFGLVTPSAHFVVLFALTALLIALAIVSMQFSFEKICSPEPFVVEENHSSYRTSLLLISRMFWMFCIMVVVTVIPYAVFSKYFVLKGVDTFGDLIPSHYFLVKEGSLPFLNQLTYQSTSIADAFRFGSYLPADTRYQNIIYFLLVFLVLLPSVQKRILSNAHLKRLIFALGIVFALSVWMAMGEKGPVWFPSFYGTVSLFAGVLYRHPNFLSDALMNLLYQGLHVLRFPNRFQLITYVISLFLMPLGIAFCVQQFMQFTWWNSTHFRRWRKIAVSILFFLPLLSSYPYRGALLSGDLGGLLAPYPTKEIYALRSELDAREPGRVLWLPYAEGPKRAVDADGMQHRFLDKFYIFYLNKPSIYFPTMGSIENKLNIFAMVNGIYAKDRGWVNQFRNLNIRYLIVNKELSVTLSNTSDPYPGFQNILLSQLENNSSFSKLFENRAFVLFEFLDTQSSQAATTWYDTDWNAFSCALREDMSFTKNNRLLLYPFGEEYNDRVRIPGESSSNPKAQLDLAAASHRESFILPDEQGMMLAYTPAIVPSSVFSLYPHSLARLNKIYSWNQTNMLLPGLFDTLSGTFVALPSATDIRFRIHLPADGNYRVYLRSMATKNIVKTWMDSGVASSVTIELSGKNVTYTKKGMLTAMNSQEIENVSIGEMEQLVPGKLIPKAVEYEYLDLGVINGKKGNHWFYMQKIDDNPLVVEGILIKKEK